jgi:alkylation response protein AidB-like acyl-CoA dehydrogenase
MNFRRLRSAPAEDSGAFLRAAARVAAYARQRAASLDETSSFPFEDVAALHEEGLLLAPFPKRYGGASLSRGDEAAFVLPSILREIGAGSLPLGRLYEGHVNAIGLIDAYGSAKQLAQMAHEARCGALFGVWAADDGEGLRLRGAGETRKLKGRKILCSGASVIERPLVTARDEEGRLWMLAPRLRRGERADLSTWTAQGMRASATGAVNFDDVPVSEEDVVGGRDDYHRQPAFSGGAWRFAAVQLGGMQALLDELRRHLVSTGRGEDPHQSARLRQAAIAFETAALWVERAAIVAETDHQTADSVVAYVNLARSAVEYEALRLLELVHRSVGLAAYMRPHPLELISRDLATYLRQPGPDRALNSAANWVLKHDGDAGSLWG